MAKKQEAMPGVKVIKPGMRYYFDDAQGACPACNCNDLQYLGRLKKTLRAALFKCNHCLCRFEKTRTKKTEPVGYVPTLPDSYTSV